MLDMTNNLPVPVLDIIEKDVYKTGDTAKIYLNISVSVGKEISNNKFEIPGFAETYKIINK